MSIKTEMYDSKTIDRIAKILLLNTEEYDCYKKFKSLDGIIITKIMGFDKNFRKANEYMLDIMKNLFTFESSFKNKILDIIKHVLFEDLNNLYFNSLINNLAKYANNYYLLTYFHYLTQKDFFKFLSNINTFSKSSRYILLDIITKSNNHRFFLVKRSNNGYNYEHDINLFSILKFRNDFDINDNEYISIIKNYLTNDYAMEHLIKFIDDILEKNKIFSNILSYNIDNYKKIASSRFLTLVLKIILIIFANIDKNNIFLNTKKDFNSTQRKEYNPDTNDTMETKIYLLALKGLRMIYNTIAILYNQLLINNSNDILSLFNLQQTHQIQEKIKIYKELIFSESLNNLINELISYYTSNFLQINSDAIDTIIQYYFNMSKNDTNYKYSKDTIEYFYKLLATPTEFCNQNFKFDILSLILGIYCYDNKDSELKNNLDLLRAIILYYDENDIFKLQDGPRAHKIYQMSLNILEKILATSTIDININSMNNLFLKFFYRTNSHTISHLEFLNMVCTEISKKVNDFNLEAYKTKCIDMIREVMKSIHISLKIVNDILANNILDPAIFRGEIIIPVITLATSVLKFFTNGKIPIYDVFNMNYEALHIMKSSLYILHKLRVNDDFKDLIHDSKKLIIESLPYIKFYDYEQNIKIELKETLEKKNNNNDNDNDNKVEDIPDEFLDPLICILIKDPIMIPNVELIFDKTSIMSQIYHEKINPYTREFLDETILEAHNKKPDIITKITEFTDKINIWKNKINNNSDNNDKR